MRGGFFMMVPLPENEFTAIVGNLGYGLIILWRFHMSSDFGFRVQSWVAVCRDKLKLEL